MRKSSKLLYIMYKGISTTLKKNVLGQSKISVMFFNRFTTFFLNNVLIVLNADKNIFGPA